MSKAGYLSRPGWQSTRGEKHPGAKLTEELVRKIRERAKTETCKAIAADLGLSKSTVSDAASGRKWGHVK